MITNFKIFESFEDTQREMINNMFSRCDNKEYIKYMSEADVELFSIDDKFDKFESIKYFLKDVYNIEIKEIEENYLVSFRAFDKNIKKIVGDYPCLFYHYTSSTLLNNILRKGLIKGYKKTNPYLNTYSGVYVTTEDWGPAVFGYVRKAIQKHGGKGITLYIKKYLKDLKQDPDDVGLRSGKFQFITEHVYPKEIIFHEEIHV